MAIITATDLAAFLQADLNTASATLCVEGAEAAVIDYCGQYFEPGVATATLLTSHGGYRVPLPKKPVASIVSVTTVEGPLTEDEDWSWDGVSPWVVLEQPEDSAEISWSYGWATIPAAVKAVVLGVAARAYANPLGLRTEAVDDYQTTYTGQSPFTLTRQEQKALSRYKTKTFSVVEG